MTSTLSREKENSIRRETSLRLAEVLRNRSSVNRWLPQYEVELGSPAQRKLLFVVLDSKKKGKKRIYTTRGAVANAEDLFISYVSRKDIKRLDYRLGREDRELLSRQRRMDIFADKWVLTKGKPARDITMFCELWARFIAVEIESSKSNRPLEGQTGVRYAVNSDYLPDYSGRTPKIVCRLKRLHKGV